MTTKKARIERNPIVYWLDDPHQRGFRMVPPLWNVWSDEAKGGAGNLVACAFTRKGAERQARWLGYSPRVWLRHGDDGGERIMPLIRWAFHRWRAQKKFGKCPAPRSTP